MTIAEYQNNLIKQILLIDDKSKLNEISKMVRIVAPKIKLLKNKVSDEEKDIMEFESFDEWDAYLQSEEYLNPDQFLPEWGMTSLQLRKFIWNAEHSGSMSYDEFVEDIKTWRVNEP